MDRNGQSYSGGVRRTRARIFFIEMDKNGQKWTVIFRRGTMQSTPKKWTEMDKNGQKWTARTPPENWYGIQKLILASTGHVNLEQVHLLRHN